MNYEFGNTDTVAETLATIFVSFILIAFVISFALLVIAFFVSVYFLPVIISYFTSWWCLLLYIPYLWALVALAKAAE